MLSLKGSSQNIPTNKECFKSTRRICPKVRALLFNKIYLQGKTIKRAAAELKLNYSSAKTIVYTQKKNKKWEIPSKISLKNNDSEVSTIVNRCSYKPIPVDKPSCFYTRIPIILTLGNKVNFDFTSNDTPATTEPTYDTHQAPAGELDVSRDYAFPNIYILTNS